MDIDQKKMLEEIEKQRERNENDIENSINNILKNDIRSIVKRSENYKSTEVKVNEILKNDFDLTNDEKLNSEYDYNKINRLNHKFKTSLNQIKNDLIISKKNCEQSLLVSDVCMRETDEFISIVKKMSVKFLELQNSIEKLQEGHEFIKNQVVKFDKIDKKLENYVNSEDKLSKKLDHLIKLNSVREDNRQEEMKKMKEEFKLSQERFLESRKTFEQIKKLILSNDDLANEIEGFKSDFYKFRDFKTTVDNQIEDIKSVQDMIEFKKLIKENENAKMLLNNSKRERLSKTFMTKDEKEQTLSNSKSLLEKQKKNNDEILNKLIYDLKVQIFKALKEDKETNISSEENLLKNKIEELSKINNDKAKNLLNEYEIQKNKILMNINTVEEILSNNVPKKTNIKENKVIKINRRRPYLI